MGTGTEGERHRGQAIQPRVGVDEQFGSCPGELWMGALQRQPLVGGGIGVARPQHQFEGAVLLRDVGGRVVALRILDDVAAEGILRLDVVGDRRWEERRVGDEWTGRWGRYICSAEDEL